MFKGSSTLQIASDGPVLSGYGRARVVSPFVSCGEVGRRLGK